MLRRSVGAAVASPWRLVVRAHRRKLSRQSGFALLAVMTAAALLGAIVGEFGYNARVELEAAANARDTLRAEYAARSGIQLSRLLIKVQQSVIDKTFNRPLNADIQIADFAPFLLGAFGGGDDERKAFGDLLGFDATSLKGMGLGRGVTMDPVMSSEDGKININCGGGLQINLPVGAAQQGRPSTVSPAVALYRVLMGLFYPPRYRRFWENAGADGQFYTAEEFARAIIDWSDVDEQRFEPLAVATGSGGSAGEDYRYDAQRDPYKAHNHYYDTVEELNLVRGVGDDFYGSFGSMLTVYGRCRVNLRAVSQQNWPLTSAIVRAAAQNPNDPALADDNIVSAMAQTLQSMMQLPGLLSNLQQIAQFLQSGALPPLPGLNQGAGQVAGANSLIPMPFGNLPGIAPDQNVLRAIARAGMEASQAVPSSREIYRIESTGAVKRAGDKKIQVRIRAIFDTQHFNQNTTSGDANDRVGTWVYWRME